MRRPAGRRNSDPPGDSWPRRLRPAVWFIAPALALIGLFFLLPVAGALLLSFTDFDLYALGDLSRLRFVGVRNYELLFQDPLFWIALKNTLYFVLVGGPLSVGFSLGAALLVNHRLVRFKGLFRTVFFLPVVTTLVAVAVVWRYLYHPRYGLLNYGLSLLGVAPIDWLGDPAWAMPAIILMAVWKNFGFNMIIFIAGLQNIPAHLYEAAAIDGAGPWRQFRHVTLPMLAPTFLFVTIITLIGYFQLFAEPYVMTQGGPANSTLSPGAADVSGRLPVVEHGLCVRRGLHAVRHHSGGYPASAQAAEGLTGGCSSRRISSRNHSRKATILGCPAVTSGHTM